MSKNVINLNLGDDVWSCGECGSTDMWLRRDGRVTCSDCNNEPGIIWIWEESNDG